MQMDIQVVTPAGANVTFRDVEDWVVDNKRVLYVYKCDDDGKYEVASFKEWNHVVKLEA